MAITYSTQRNIVNTSKTLSRRPLAKGAAWAAPVVLASSAIPAYASSVPDCSWLATQNVVETSVSNEFSDNGNPNITVADWGNQGGAGVSYKFGTSDAKKAIPARYKAGPISSAYVMQDEVTALKAENLRMKQRDEELSAKYEQVQRDNEEMKAQIAMLMKQAGLTK